MATPREILRRSEGRKCPTFSPAPAPMAERCPPVPAGIAPAPQMPAVPIVPPVQPPAPSAERVIVPQPIRSNSVYHQLMASHDRMHTRHVKG